VPAAARCDRRGQQEREHPTNHRPILDLKH
jgi:hypothetical protein